MGVYSALQQDWNETAVKQHDKIVFRNQDDYMKKKDRSIVSDVFGGVLRSEFHVEGSRQHSVTFEPFFVLSVPVTENESSIEDCLASYFQEEAVSDYKDESTGRFVKASRTLRFEKLPNILIINLKRFLWVPRSNRLIKKREHIYFEDVLDIDDKFVSPHVQIGVFGERSRRYRLFSVVEHIGKDANRGHYINYSLDS